MNHCILPPPFVVISITLRPLSSLFHMLKMESSSLFVNVVCVFLQAVHNGLNAMLKHTPADSEHEMPRSSTEDFVGSLVKVENIDIDQAQGSSEVITVAKCRPKPVNPRNNIRDVPISIEQLVEYLDILAREL